MRHQKKQAYTIALQWGLITTAITALFSLFFLIFGLYDVVYRLRENGETLVYLLSLVFAMIYAIYVFKKENDGFLSIGMAIKIGIVTALSAAFGWILYNLIFITILYPDYYMNYYYGTLGEQAWEAYYSINPDIHTKESYAIHAEEALSREFESLYFLIIIMSTLVALLVTPIIGAFMRKKKKQVK